MHGSSLGWEGNQFLGNNTMSASELSGKCHSQHSPFTPFGNCCAAVCMHVCHGGQGKGVCAALLCFLFTAFWEEGIFLSCWPDQMLQLSITSSAWALTSWMQCEFPAGQPRLLSKESLGTEYSVLNALRSISPVICNTSYFGHGTWKFHLRSQRFPSVVCLGCLNCFKEQMLLNNLCVGLASFLL